MSDTQKQLMIRIASILSWVLGVLCFLVLLAILVPAIAKGDMGNVGPIISVFALFCILYCVIGWGLGKFLKWSAILAFIISGINFLLNLLGIAANPSAIIGVLVSGSMIALLILGWKALK